MKSSNHAVFAEEIKRAYLRAILNKNIPLSVYRKAVNKMFFSACKTHTLSCTSTRYNYMDGRRKPSI